MKVIICLKEKKHIESSSATSSKKTETVNLN